MQCDEEQEKEKANIIVKFTDFTKKFKESMGARVDPNSIAYADLSKQSEEKTAIYFDSVSRCKRCFTVTRNYNEHTSEWYRVDDSGSSIEVKYYLQGCLR